MNASRISTLVPLFCLAATASAQNVGIPVFSIDWTGQTISAFDSFTFTPITEGDLLAPATVNLMPALGPLPTPGIVESAGALAPVGLGLGTHAGCIGHPPYTQCPVEVDALSHAMDHLGSVTSAGTIGTRWAFSINFRGQGVVGTPFPPAIWTENACRDEGADVWIDLGMPPGPLPPIPPLGHTGYIDGNGLASCSGFLYPGTGLTETPPGVVPGDNLDALDDDVPDRVLPRTTCSYFSLDSGLFDPVLLIPNSGSAVANGFVGGDVLVSCPGCAPSVYAAAAQLGLDASGPDTDDLDALVLRENGIPGYQRSAFPNDWINGNRDMLFFSVRRGSAIIGTPDAVFGLPITESDILFPTGPAGSPPGIWIAGEGLGLNVARVAGAVNDDIDALDSLQEPQPGNGFCFGDGTGTPCPCANNGFTGRGCGNSQNALGALLWANGTASIANDTVHFTSSGTPPNAQGLLFQGTVPLAGVVFGDGLRCVAGAIQRLMVRNALCGNREYGYGVFGDQRISVAGGIGAPVVMHYQVRYRDANPTFCSPPATWNWTNGYTIAWTP